MRITRYEKRHVQKSEEQKVMYMDNKGVEYEHKFIAQASSFYNIVMGMFKNGFPVVVPRLWYSAWAFYPFFFVRSDMRCEEEPLVILNHERIHVRQQRDLHIVISVPLIILSFWFPMWLLIVPFVPTFFYYVDLVRVYFQYKGTMPQEDRHKFSELRKYTSFEAEAISNSTNLDYLYKRKFFAVLGYIGINKK